MYFDSLFKKHNNIRFQLLIVWIECVIKILFFNNSHFFIKIKYFQSKEINTFANLNFEMIKIQFFILILFFGLSSRAQFLNEIGIFGGGSNYSGDIGNEMYIAPNSFAGSIIYRRNLNERVTLRGTLSIYPIKDNDKNSSNIVRQNRGMKFTNTINELSLGIELNYLDYDITSYENNYTPYLFFEISGFQYSVVSSVTDGTYNFTSNVAFALPIGIGFKSGLTRNLAYAVEFRTRYALADDLDYSSESIPELNFGNPKNNDWYFFVGAGLTYSFGRPPCAVQPRY